MPELRAWRQENNPVVSRIWSNHRVLGDSRGSKEIVVRDSITESKGCSDGREGSCAKERKWPFLN